MGERFTYDEAFIYDNNKALFNTKELIALLNSLDEENQGLRIENEELKREVKLFGEFFRKNNFTLDDFNKWLIEEKLEMGKHYCTDCYFMYYHDEENFEDMDCSHGHAIPENGSPEIINGSDPHNCPYFKWRDDL